MSMVRIRIVKLIYILCAYKTCVLQHIVEAAFITIVCVYLDCVLWHMNGVNADNMRPNRALVPLCHWNGVVHRKCETLMRASWVSMLCGLVYE